jgi:hypothetical protein
MKSTLIKDTTKSERIALVKQWEEEEGCENSGMNLSEITLMARKKLQK